MNNDDKISKAINDRDYNTVFSVLYKYTLPKISAFIRNNGGSVGDAEDVFQDAVIILIRVIKENKLQKHNNFEGFVHVIAKNVWIDKKRKEKRELQYEIDEMEEPEMKDYISESIEMKERKNQLFELLHQLGEKCFGIIKAIVEDNKDYKEIAELMGLGSGDVVKTYKNRCKKKLIELLQKNSSFKKQLLQYERGFERYI